MSSWCRSHGSESTSRGRRTGMSGLLAITDKFVNQLRDAWRSRWWGLLAAASVCAVGWPVVLLVPSVYEAKASVYVNTSSSLAPILKGLAVESDLSSQLELVKQLLLSRELLQAVLAQTPLYDNQNTEQDRDLLIAELRKRLQLSGGRAARDNLYTITFRDPQRTRALSVVRSLLDNFIVRTIGTKHAATDSAQRFLLSQKAEYERRLSAAENRLADFKRQNIGLLPGDRADYFTRLQQELQARAVAQTRLAQLKSQRGQLQRQLSGESPVTTLPGAGFDPGAQKGADSAAAPGNAIDQRISEAENKLSQMRLKWTDMHPDVIAQRDLLERLRAERAGYLQALGVKGRTDGPISIESNPVYTSLRSALSQVELKIIELTSEASSHSVTIAQLEQAADTLPRVEAEYQQQTRDYGVLNSQYQEVVKRLETARLSAEAEQSEDVDFRLIEPATASNTPVAPKRLLLLPAVFVVALALGVWIALLRSRVTPVFYTISDLSQLANLPFLGSVGNTRPDLVRTRKLRATLGFVSLCAALLVVLGLSMVTQLPGMSSRLSLAGVKWP
jgi:polysaccharide chain length determinant protein (PEP-CTERM system associated)